MIRSDRSLLQVKMALLFGFALVIVGAFMPWVSGPFSQSGMEGNGVLTLLLAGLGSLIALFDRRPRGMLIAVSVAAMVVVISIVDFVDISGATIGTPEIGLYFTIAGGVIASLAGGVLAFNLFKRPAQQASKAGSDEGPGKSTGVE